MRLRWRRREGRKRGTRDSMTIDRRSTRQSWAAVGGDGRDGCERRSVGEALVLQKFRFLLGVVRDFAKISLSRILSRF